MVLNEIKSENIIISENGKSFLKCPKCDSNLISPCDCEPKNYKCTNCEWGYLNHTHISQKQNINPTYLNYGSILPFRMPN